MKYEGIVKISMHEELPKGSRVIGDKIMGEPLVGELSWLRVKLSNGVNRDVLVNFIRKIDDEYSATGDPDDGYIK